MNILGGPENRIDGLGLFISQNYDEIVVLHLIDLFTFNKFVYIKQVCLHPISLMQAFVYIKQVCLHYKYMMK